MTNDRMQFRPAYRQTRLHPAFGLAAAAATAMTLGLAVILPMQLAPAAQQAHVDPKHVVLAPTEVAILPAKIEVVAARERAAQEKSPYLPAAYKPRS